MKTPTPHVMKQQIPRPNSPPHPLLHNLLHYFQICILTLHNLLLHIPHHPHRKLPYPIMFHLPPTHVLPQMPPLRRMIITFLNPLPLHHNELEIKTQNTLTLLSSTPLPSILSLPPLNLSPILKL